MIALYRLLVRNFLSLQDVDVPLRDLNVLVGPNGAGKSNLLRAIQFLGDTARDDLAPTIAKYGGMSQIHFRGATRSGEVRFEVHAAVTRYARAEALDEYSLSFSQRKGGPTNRRLGPPRSLVRKEEFKFKRTKGAGRRIKINGEKVEVVDNDSSQKQQLELEQSSAGLSTLQRMGNKLGAPQWRELAEVFETFRVFEVDVAAARRPSPMEDQPVLAADAGNLASFLYWLFHEHPEVFELLVDDLRFVVPSIKGLAFQSLGGTTDAVKLTLEEDHLRGITDLAYASFGTIRALALLAMLHDPQPPKLTCVEEIDHGLHPYALDRIVERLRSATRRTQLLLATHSPALVNRLKPEELIICERDPSTGASRIPAIDPAEVKAVADQDELGGLRSARVLWFS